MAHWKLTTIWVCINIYGYTSFLTGSNNDYFLLIICPGNIIYRRSSKQCLILIFGDEILLSVTPSNYPHASLFIPICNIISIKRKLHTCYIVNYLTCVNFWFFWIQKISYNQILLSAICDYTFFSRIRFNWPLNSLCSFCLWIWCQNSLQCELLNWFH